VPHHANPALVALVAVGGAAGSLARYVLSRVLPPQHAVPVATLVENVTGAFLLGLLLESLVLAGPETPRRRRARLALGTGVLGGYTTYSSFALELHGLLAAGRAGLALAYALVTVVVGAVACWLAVLLAVTLRARRARGPRAVRAAVVDRPGQSPRGASADGRTEQIDAPDELAAAGEPS
jgi:CrcB protein